TEQMRERLPEVPRLMERARVVLAGAMEPAVRVGVHCGSPYECPFYAHCAPAQGEYPLEALGGRAEWLFELLHEGFRDLREVPEERLRNDRQRTVWQWPREGRAFVGAGFGEFVRGLGFPRYY